MGLVLRVVLWLLFVGELLASKSSYYGFEPDTWDMSYPAQAPSYLPQAQAQAQPQPQPQAPGYPATFFQPRAGYQPQQPRYQPKPQQPQPIPQQPRYQPKPQQPQPIPQQPRYQPIPQQPRYQPKPQQPRYQPSGNSGSHLPAKTEAITSTGGAAAGVSGTHLGYGRKGRLSYN